MHPGVTAEGLCNGPISDCHRAGHPLQEFQFPDAVRLWDTLFSDPAGRTDCLLRICVAMLINVRTELLQVPVQSNITIMT